MAPTAPTKRKPLRLKSAERLANPLLPRKVHRPDSAVTDTFLSTKTDKRLIKHASFVSRITKPASTPASRKNAKRAAKKRDQIKTFAAEGLLDALPTLTDAEVAGGQTEREGRVRHKSIKSARGALKKKERVVRSEMERFGMSLAQLETVKEAAAPPVPAAVPAAGDAKMEGVEDAPAASGAAGRFAALRGFIAATMEQNPAFAARKVDGKGT
ncbi:hypothetical protein N0V93_003710 [Gnomoniopsis smithogilvyi]|uniref:Ribosome biogenesis protein SLX9 n=1 Tax=Gnomoniopsis smithogilvyi TaxID=1191159 RepID=A0A9W8Z0Y8_9PEZI|nr:hypothetical protein N0V93_003710 [Gnomoniopsis smithogilvyi]